MSTEPKRFNRPYITDRAHAVPYTFVDAEAFDALARERDEQKALADTRLADAAADHARFLCELDALRAQLRASREAFGKHGAHASDCGIMSLPSKCDCGYDELDAALQSTPQLAKNEGEKPSTNAHIHGIKS